MENAQANEYKIFFRVEDVLKFIQSIDNNKYKYENVNDILVAFQVGDDTKKDAMAISTYNLGIDGNGRYFISIDEDTYKNLYDSRIFFFVNAQSKEYNALAEKQFASNYVNFYIEEKGKDFDNDDEDVKLNIPDNINDNSLISNTDNKDIKNDLDKSIDNISFHFEDCFNNQYLKDQGNYLNDKVSPEEIEQIFNQGTIRDKQNFVSDNLTAEEIEKMFFQK